MPDIAEPPPGTTLRELLTHYRDYLKEGSWLIATSSLEPADQLPDRAATDAIVDRLAERMLDRSRFEVQTLDPYLVFRGGK